MLKCFTKKLILSLVILLGIILILWCSGLFPRLIADHSNFEVLGLIVQILIVVVAGWYTWETSLLRKEQQRQTNITKMQYIRALAPKLVVSDIKINKYDMFLNAENFSANATISTEIVICLSHNHKFYLHREIIPFKKHATFCISLEKEFDPSRLSSYISEEHICNNIRSGRKTPFVDMPIILGKMWIVYRDDLLNTYTTSISYQQKEGENPIITSSHWEIAHEYKALANIDRPLPVNSNKYP